MAKFIGVKMIEAVPMTAREANDKGYRIGNHSFEEDGFEVHGQSSCVKTENFNLRLGATYAQIKAEDKICEFLGFVLQWAKYGLKR